jgi:hypothetical protein
VARRREPFDLVDWSRVHLHGGDGGVAELIRRVTLLVSGGRAVTLGNHVFLPRHSRQDVVLLAHELTHCAQYQAWGAWRYFTRGAREQIRDLLHRSLGIGVSPYRYVIERGKPLHAYGMEQQAQIIEDRVRSSLPTALAHSHRDRRSSP